MQYVCYQGAISDSNQYWRESVNPLEKVSVNPEVHSVGNGNLIKITAAPQKT